MNPQMQRIRTGPEPIELVVGPAVAAPNVEYILYLKKKDCEVKRAGFKNCSYCTHSSCQCWIVKIFDEEKERKVLQENDRFDKLKNIPVLQYHVLSLHHSNFYKHDLCLIDLDISI